MSMSNPSLAELLRKTAGGHELTYTEFVAVKKLFQDLRRRSREVLAECAEDEARTIGIHWALTQYEQGRIAADECFAEIQYIYRDIYDIRRRARLLRCDIAFYAALSTLFIHTRPITRRRALDLAVSHELLANMDHLQAALSRYVRCVTPAARPVIMIEASA